MYFLLTACSYPALALYNANAALLRASKDMRTPMRIALMVNVMNIGGNYLFIFVLNMGVAGAALSTLICRIAAAVVTTAILHRSRGAVSLAGLFRVRFVGSMVKDILGVGIPSFLENSMFFIGKLLTQRILPCVHGVGHVKFIADVCVLPLANEDAVDIHAAEGIQHCAKEHGSSQNRTGRGFSR